MSQATGTNQILNQKSSSDRRAGAIRMPFDGIIEFVANKVGGSKAIEVERFLRFAFVGAIGAVIDLGVSNVLWATILPLESADGERILLNVLVGGTISFICAVLSNFTWNRYWTYPDSRSRPIMRQLVQFGVVSLTGWLGRVVWLAIATNPLTNMVESIFSNTSLDAYVLQIGATVALLIGIFVVMIWNFFVNRYWTYNDVD